MESVEQSGRQAFERFVRPEIPLLLRVARTLTDQPVDAEDLVQETLVQAYRSLERFDGAYPRAWLLTIMRNTESKRRRRKRPQLLGEAPLQHAADRANPVRRTPENALVEQTFDAALERALADLPERFRQPIELVDMNGLTYQEAAQALRIPQGTVTSRVHRARRRLRNHLSPTHLARKNRSS